MDELLRKSVFSLFLELPIVPLFFRYVPAVEPLTRRRRAMSLIPLLLLGILYDWHFFDATHNLFILRYSYRLAMYLLYVRLRTKQPFRDCLHFAMLCTFYASMAQTIIRSPAVSDFIQSLRFPHPLWTDAVSALLEALLNLLVALAIVFGIPIRKVRRLDLPQALVLAFSFLASVYIRQHTGAHAFEGDASADWLFSLYNLLLSVFLLSFLVSFERYICANEDHMQDHLQVQANEYELRALRLQQLHETNVRAVYHDIRSHFLALDGILAAGDLPRARRYVGDLIAEAGHGHLPLETGNLVLNSLLDEKLQIASLQGIRFECDLDFRKGAFMKDVDVCAVFGNALDNALEACAALSPDSDRFIRVRGREQSGCLIFAVDNSTAGRPSLREGIPVTSKPDAAHHGYGLRNIRRTLGRYGGRMTVDLSEETCFRLRMALPIPPEEASGMQGG